MLFRSRCAKPADWRAGREQHVLEVEVGDWNCDAELGAYPGRCVVWARVESERNDVVLAPRVVPEEYKETYDGHWTTAGQAGATGSTGEADNSGQAGVYNAAQVDAGNVEARRPRTRPVQSDAKAFLAEVICGGTAGEATRRPLVRRVAPRRRPRRSSQKSECPHWTPKAIVEPKRSQVATSETAFLTRPARFLGSFW